MMVHRSTITRPEVRRGPAVTVAIHALPNTYDPNSTDAVGYRTEVAALTLPSPYLVDPRGNVALDTDLMKSVTLHTNPQKIVYRINPKAVWSDGAPVDCGDFYLAWLSNVSRAHDPKHKDEPAFHLLSAPLYDQIDAPACSHHGRTVTVTFNTESANWRSLFRGLLPAHVAIKDAGISHITKIKKTDTSGPVLALAKAYNKDFGTIRPSTAVSAGPYVVTSVDKSSITLKRNSRWWGNPAGPSKIRLIVAKDDAIALRDMQNGNADATSLTSLSAKDAPSVKQADHHPDVTRSDQAWPLGVHIEFNLHHKLFSGKAGKALRRAVFTCIDRTDLLKDTIRPIAPQARLLGNMLVEPWNPAYTDHYSDYKTADPAKARKIMESAGWKMGDDGVFTHGSTKAAFNLGSLYNPRREQVSRLIQQQCKAAGIAVKPKNIDAVALFSGKFQAALFAWSAPIEPAGYSYTFGSGSGGNFMHYSNEKVDALLDKIQSDVKPRDQSDRLNKIDKLVAADHVMLPLYDEPVINLQRDRIRTTVTNNYFWGGPVWDAYAWSVAGN